MQLQLTVLARRQEELSGQAGIAEDEAPPPHY
jgi:SlyX protein